MYYPRFSLQNEFPCESESAILSISIFIKDSTSPLFCKFLETSFPLNKDEDFPAMKGVRRVLTLS